MTGGVACLRGEAVGRLVLEIRNRVDLHDAFGIFFVNDPATAEIYTLSLHDALPISSSRPPSRSRPPVRRATDTSRRTSLAARSEEHTSELQSHSDIVCSLLLEK